MTNILAFPDCILLLYQGILHIYHRQIFPEFRWRHHYKATNDKQTLVVLIFYVSRYLGH